MSLQYTIRRRLRVFLRYIHLRYTIEINKNVWVRNKNPFTTNYSNIHNNNVHKNRRFVNTLGIAMQSYVINVFTVFKRYTDDV
jgi:hypothetical protein